MKRANEILAIARRVQRSLEALPEFPEKAAMVADLSQMVQMVETGHIPLPRETVVHWRTVETEIF